MMKEILAKIIGKKVKRLLLVVWPPYGEDDIAQIDISAGYIFEGSPKELFIISTDMNDLTRPSIEVRPVPNKNFGWNEFEQRMENWMNCVDGDIDTEYYDVTDANVFKNIVNQDVVKVELIQVGENDVIGVIAENDVIGVKVIFKDDYILSTPIIDGNTIETAQFNQHSNLRNFVSLGKIVYKNVIEE